MQRRCAERPTSSNGLYGQGCYTKVKDFIEDNSAIIGGVCIGILVVMLVNFGIALYMWCAIAKGRPRRGDYDKARARDY